MMATKWRKRCLVLLSAAALCLLAACERNMAQQLAELGEQPAPHLVTPSDLREKFIAEAHEAYNQEMAASFNEDWRAELAQMAADHGSNLNDYFDDMVNIMDMSVAPADGRTDFEVSDYQRIVRDYLKLYGDTWLEESAKRPGSR